MVEKSGLLALVVLAGLIALPVAMAQGSDDFAQAKALIDRNASCGSLSSEQLELIGDYVMEQIHPGEAHEYVESMMGGEGSDSLKRAHIAMAYRFYCAGLGSGLNANSPYYGVMGGYGMMGGMMYGNYGGMMGSGNAYSTYGLMGYGGGTANYPGMMGYNASTGGLGLLTQVLFVVALGLAVLFLGIKVFGQFQKR
ncbi:MAG: hypothetical protein HY394_02285 [Candidatus Diapherotrites archaeon]|nr:hypothetical protein [Candidatus Diapherotrites archaeon]